MSTFDPATDWRELTEHYRRLTDDELIAIAQNSADLTDTAQQVLRQEITSRRLNIEQARDPEPPKPARDPGEPDPYDEDRQLVNLCGVWSRADALKLQAILVAAGIPFFIGPEKASSVDAVTSGFGDGLDVRVMKIGLRHAIPLMQHYEPLDVPTDAENPEGDGLAIHCPKCHSDDVTFDAASAQPDDDTITQKFRWICNTCSNTWEDDGIET